MIAYNKIWLNNLAAREEVEDALYAGSIGDEEKQQAEKALPVGFYSPNFFIRLGLFALTVIIACFSLALLCLLFLTANDQALSGLILFFGLFAYAFLEFFVRTKHHYKSGVDDALLWISTICVVSGINLLANVSTAANALIIFMLATYFLLRFADMLMGAIAAVALLAVIFLNYIPLGIIAKATVPFLLMLITAVIYFVVKKIKEQSAASYYTQCYIVLEIVMLICFYTFSNYYVVQQTSIEMFGSTPAAIENVSWIFWIFTVCTPLIYIIWGISKKESLLIRVGLLLVAAIVFTIRYYFTVMPAEMLMLLGGIIMIVFSYALTKYLAETKKGFTSAEINTRQQKDEMNIEGLIIAETFAGSQAQSDPQFGGGSFGGGGASGDF